MDDDDSIGLPPPKDAPAPVASSGASWFARGVNLFGLVSPAANLGLVFVARRERRWFGLGAGVVCALVLLYALSRDKVWLAWTAGSVHYALVLAGLIQPQWVEKIGDVWIRFGAVVAKVMVIPIFAAMYYLVVTPTGLLARAFGKDLLGGKSKSAATYWTKHEPPPKERYERQF